MNKPTRVSEWVLGDGREAALPVETPDGASEC